MPKPARRSFWEALQSVLTDATGYDLPKSPKDMTEQQAGMAAAGLDNMHRLGSTLAGGIGMGPLAPLGMAGGALADNIAEGAVQGATGTAAQKLLGLLGSKGAGVRALAGGASGLAQYVFGRVAGDAEDEARGKEGSGVNPLWAAVATATGMAPAGIEKILGTSKSMKARQAFDQLTERLGMNPVGADAPHGAIVEARTPAAGEAQQTVVERLTPPTVKPDDPVPSLRLQREKALERRTAIEAEAAAADTARTRQTKEKTLTDTRKVEKSQESAWESLETKNLKNDLVDLENQLRLPELTPTKKATLRSQIADTRKKLNEVAARPSTPDTTPSEISELRQTETELMRQRDQAKIAQADKDIEILDLEIAKASMQAPEWNNGLTVAEAKRLQPLADAATSQEFFDKAYRHAMRTGAEIPDQADPEIMNSLYKVWQDAGSEEAPKVFQTNFLTDFLKHSYDEATGTFSKANDIYRKVGPAAFEAAFGGDSKKAQFFTDFVTAMNKAMPAATFGQRSVDKLKTAAMFGMPDFVVFHLARNALGSTIGGAGAVAGYEILKKTKWRDLMDAMVRDPKTGQEMLKFLQSGDATTQNLRYNRALNLAIQGLPGKETSVRERPVEERFTPDDLSDIEKVLGR